MPWLPTVPREGGGVDAVCRFSFTTSAREELREELRSERRPDSPVLVCWSRQHRFSHPSAATKASSTCSRTRRADQIREVL
ncbi:hypothetical protein MHYP_G00143610 [Metynnis hypsauchen]